MSDYLSYQKRLMIVDDDEGIADLIRTVAEDLGIEVAVANDYDAVGTIIDEFRPNLIVLDLCLPPHDGVEVLNLLSQKHCDARVYMISGLDQTILASACIVGRQNKLDIGGSFQKPFEIEDIEACLSAELDTRSRFTSEKIQACLGPGEFVINYQPIISCSAEGKLPVVGVEARPHWRDGRGSMVWLSQVLYRLRVNNLQQEFNNFLLDKALESYSGWMEIAPEMGITFNVHESILAGSNWLKYLNDAVDKWDIPHDRVTIGLDHEAFKENSIDSLDIVTRLRISGFKIALETSGTDIAELEDLMHLPFSELRLKRVLVNRVGDNMEAEFNASTLVSLAKKKNLQTCALAVHSLEAFRFLRDCECTTATGRFFGESLASDRVGDFIRERVVQQVKDREKAEIC